MVEGPSGLLAIAPPWDRPRYEPSKRRVTWPNGAVAICYNATEPDQLRGPQHEAAWCDELAKWRLAQDCWDTLTFGMRIGPAPRCVITTTPRPIPLLRNLMKLPGTVVTRGSTYDNRDNLSREFLEELAAYEGTRLGRQELHAEILEDFEGSLWSLALLDACRVISRDEVPHMKRRVVDVDPSGTSAGRGAQQGIVVVGKGENNLFYVLADYSCSETPQGWAERAVQAYANWGCDMIIAEKNFGGEMVRHTIKSVAPNIPLKLVNASRGKHVRAEPIAALYESGRVRHLGYFRELEEQMSAMTHLGYEGAGSADRVDALVWGLTELAMPAQKVGIAGRARY